MQQSLLIGCGNSREKRVAFNDQPGWAGELVTLDMSPTCGADVIHDLEALPLPFGDATFDEMGAFDVLEHLGQNGDWRKWFDQMAEFHRILKPGGRFFILVPINNDWYADPGHGRFIAPAWFAFLNQDWYRKELERGAPVTDYRWYWQKNFNVAWMEQQGDHHLATILVKA